MNEVYFVVGIRHDESGSLVRHVEQHSTLDFATRATGRLRFDEGFERAYVYKGVAMRWDAENKTYVEREG